MPSTCISAGKPSAAAGGSAAAVAARQFREDLFYRLQIVPILMPPLRERIEDLRLLAAHFLHEFTSAYGRKPKELSEEAWKVLEGALKRVDEDDRFLVSNQQHALHVAPLAHRYLARNPYYAAPGVVNNICAYGYPAKVIPDAPPDPWRLKRSQLPEWVKFYGAAETDMGLVTAACAPHIYRGDQFPPEYRGMHFSCECAYNLIHLCRLEPDGAGYKVTILGRLGAFAPDNQYGVVRDERIRVFPLEEVGA